MNIFKGQVIYMHPRKLREAGARFQIGRGYRHMPPVARPCFFISLDGFMQWAPLFMNYTQGEELPRAGRHGANVLWRTRSFFLDVKQVWTINDEQLIFAATPDSGKPIDFSNYLELPK